VECAREDDLLNRRESFRIRPSTHLRIVDDSLNRKVDGRVPWRARKAALAKHISPSLESLMLRFDEDRTSLGLIKVHELLDFYRKSPFSKMDLERSDTVQRNLFGDDRTLLERIPHMFYYRFRCSHDCPNAHDMSIEDWELFESFRSWSHRYRDPDMLWSQLRHRYLDDFRKADLHFFVGTHSRWPVWMIIGAFYPPAVECGDSKEHGSPSAAKTLENESRPIREP